MHGPVTVELERGWRGAADAVELGHGGRRRRRAGGSRGEQGADVLAQVEDLRSRAEEHVGRLGLERGRGSSRLRPALVLALSGEQVVGEFP